MRTALLLASVAALGAPVAPVLAAEATSPKLIVMEARKADSSAKLRSAITQGIEGAVVELIPQERLAGRLAHCELPGCLPRIAKATGATHVLRVDARYASGQFKMTLELWDARGSTLVTTDRSDCVICDEEQFLDTVADRIKTVISSSLHVGAVPAAAPPDPAPARVAVALDRPSDASATARPAPIRTAQPAPEEASSLQTWTGVSLLVAGAVGVGFGIHYGRVNDPICAPGDALPCDFVRNTRTKRNLFLGGGVLAAVGGLTVLLWPRSQGGTAVALGPTGFVVGGSF